MNYRARDGEKELEIGVNRTYCLATISVKPDAMTVWLKRFS